MDKQKALRALAGSALLRTTMLMLGADSQVSGLVEPVTHFGSIGYVP